MHPPRELQNLLKTFKKTKAVDKLAEAEQKLFGRSPDPRQIWRSYKRVDQFIGQIEARMQAESSGVAPPTKPPDREPRANTKESEKGRRSTRHPKHVKHK